MQSMVQTQGTAMIEKMEMTMVRMVMRMMILPAIVVRAAPILWVSSAARLCPPTHFHELWLNPPLLNPGAPTSFQPLAQQVGSHSPAEKEQKPIQAQVWCVWFPGLCLFLHTHFPLEHSAVSPLRAPMHPGAGCVPSDPTPSSSAADAELMEKQVREPLLAAWSFSSSRPWGPTW